MRWAPGRHGRGPQREGERTHQSWANHNKIAGVMDEEIAHLEGWFASGWVDASLPRETEQGPRDGPSA